MKAFISILILTLVPLIAGATGPSANPYAVSNIRKELLLNANAVVRTHQMVQYIDNVLESKTKVKKAVTLLNEKAAGKRYVYILHDKFIKISGIKAYIYDSNGEPVLNARADIRDVSGNFGDLASDTRYWVISFPVRKYPYTIEYEYEKTETGAYILDNWSFQEDDDVSVEQSGTQISVKKGIGIKAYGKNLNRTCDTVTMPDRNIFTWQEENIPALKTEDLFMISFWHKMPLLRLTPVEFKMGGISGSMENWETVGRYFYNLNKDRDNISPDLQGRLKQMTAGQNDKKEIVNTVFQYLQKNTRYVSIQLGIGGHQTLEASFVEKKGYGDCKALSNYMKAMLKSLGIPSYLTLVASQNPDDIITSFPSDQFDHVILCVPLANDTVWLECTSQTIPFNYLGSSISNKHVLLLTENGGKLVKTPDYKSINNSMYSNFSIGIDIAGNATLKGKIKFEGASFEAPRARLNSNKEDREDFVNLLFATPNLNINKLTYKEEVNKPGLLMECDFVARDFVSKTKKRMIFNPYLFEPVSFLSDLKEEDFQIKATRTASDTAVFSFPFGFKIEYIPQPVNIETRFGTFSYDCKMDKGRLIAVRRLKLIANEYKRDDLKEFVVFANKVAACERQLAVLVKE